MGSKLKNLAKSGLFGLGGFAAAKGGFFNQGEVTTDPYSLYSPQQRELLHAIEQLAKTGSYGDIKLGEAYKGSLGNYEMTGIESQGQDLLRNLLNGGGTARKVYEGFANTEFNPDDPSSGFAAFSRQVARAQENANNVLNRESAMTGSRLNTGLQRRKQDLQAQTNDSLQTELARLFENAQSRKMAGAQGLQQLDSEQLQQSQTFGSLSRDLMNQEAQVKYNEFLRQNQEKLSRIGLMKDATSTPMGPITTNTPSLFDKLIGPATQIASAYFTGGASSGMDLSKLFQGSTGSGSPSGSGKLSFGNYGL